MRLTVEGDQIVIVRSTSASREQHVTFICRAASPSPPCLLSLIPDQFHVSIDKVPDVPTQLPICITSLTSGALAWRRENMTFPKEKTDPASNPSADPVLCRCCKTQAPHSSSSIPSSPTPCVNPLCFGNSSAPALPPFVNPPIRPFFPPHHHNSLPFLSPHAYHHR